jgi:CBS domain-containing protein
MITDRDIVVRGVALGRDPRATQVSEVMTPEVTYCFENDEVEKAADLMKEDQIRRLIVLDENKKLVGIIALGDISQEAGERLTGEVLGKVSEPPGPTLH